MAAIRIRVVAAALTAIGRLPENLRTVPSSTQQENLDGAETDSAEKRELMVQKSWRFEPTERNPHSIVPSQHVDHNKLSAEDVAEANTALVAEVERCMGTMLCTMLCGFLYGVSRF